MSSVSERNVSHFSGFSPGSSVLPGNSQGGFGQGQGGFGQGGFVQGAAGGPGKIIFQSYILTCKRGAMHLLHFCTSITD